MQDSGYDTARLSWLRNYDSRPALVVEAANSSDIQKAITYASSHILPIAIQSSGHGAIKPIDGAVLIKTHQLKSIRIDVENQTATFEPGVIAGDLVQAASTYGLSPITGDSPYVGATGFTLGGGQGWLSRQYGLGANSIIAAQLAIASGEIITVSATENTDLFWGLKGGSGNFGVVVSLTIKLHPVIEGFGGAVYFGAEHAAPLLELYSRWALNLPNAYTAFLQAFNLPNIPQVPEQVRGKRVVALQLFFNDASDKAHAVLQDFLHTLRIAPLANFTAPTTYAAFMALAPNLPPTAALDVSGLQTNITAKQIPKLAQYIEGVSGFAPVIQIRPWGGALANPEDDSLLQYGDVGYSIYAVQSLTPENSKHMQAQFASLEKHIKAYSDHKAFINFTADPTAMDNAYSEAARVKLHSLKVIYDPNNLFRLGHTLNTTA